MDGGRVLRAALWHWRGDFRQATRVATNAGKGFGMLLMALGVLSVVTGNFVGGMWWFLIGMFVRGAAASSYQQMLSRSLFAGEPVRRFRSEEHTSELQSLMRISYAVFCLKKKKTQQTIRRQYQH